MNYWWVNQNQTHRQEIGGGYVWAPKSNEAGNPEWHWETMLQVKSGDIVFAYYNKQIQQVGIALTNVTDSHKPVEFEKEWNEEGRLIEVEWQELPTPFSPKKHLKELEGSLPKKYSPIRSNGDGVQAYLMGVSVQLAEKLAELGGIDLLAFANGDVSSEVLQAIHEGIQSEALALGLNNTDIEETCRKAVVEVRTGQGKFKRNLRKVEHKCRVTGLDAPGFLIASHIKPWRDCETSAERVDGNNGLWLTPNADKLFDKGFISFTDNGEMLVSSRVDPIAMTAFHMPKSLNVGSFNSAQQNYLAFHREHVFKV